MASDPSIAVSLARPPRHGLPEKHQARIFAGYRDSSHFARLAGAESVFEELGARFMNQLNLTGVERPEHLHVADDAELFHHIRVRPLVKPNVHCG
jgi:hypothetical protein